MLYTDHFFLVTVHCTRMWIVLLYVSANHNAVATIYLIELNWYWLSNASIIQAKHLLSSKMNWQRNKEKKTNIHEKRVLINDAKVHKMHPKIAVYILSVNDLNHFDLASSAKFLNLIIYYIHFHKMMIDSTWNCSQK